MKEAGRPAGYTNIATEFDDVVRYQGVPSEGSSLPSFSEMLADAAGKPTENRERRIVWLRGGGGADPS